MAFRADVADPALKYVTNIQPLNRIAGADGGYWVSLVAPLSPLVKLLPLGTTIRYALSHLLTSSLTKYANSAPCIQLDKLWVDSLTTGQNSGSDGTTGSGNRLGTS